jgi:hypothetical protein
MKAVGLDEHLVLMTVYQTCRYHKVNFPEISAVEKLGYRFIRCGQTAAPSPKRRRALPPRLFSAAYPQRATAKHAAAK